MKLKLFTLIFLFSIKLAPQNLETLNSSLILNNAPHTSYLGSESVNPFIINQIQSSLNTRIKPFFSISLKSNSGNVMVHKTTLLNKNGGEVQIDYDAVFEKDALQITYPLNASLEGFIEFSINSSSEKGIYNPMNWIVSDHFIEEIHDVMGKTDLYKRKELGFDHFAHRIDTKTSIEKNSIYTKPFITGLTYYFEIQKNEKKITTANLSHLIRFQLENISMNRVEVGLSLNITSTKKIAKKISFTSSIHNSIYYHGNDLRNSFTSQRRKMSYKFTGLLGLNIHNKKSDNMYSIFTTLNKTSSRLKAGNYYTNGNKLNQQALSAATEGNEYLEIGGNYSYSFKNKNTLTLEITFREDLVIDLGKINRVLNGRNAEDFGVFFGLKYLIP